MEYVEKYINETIEVANKIDKKKICEAIDLISLTKKKKGRLFILGVGGSAANASHAVNDFRKIAGIESYAPTDNVAEITARTNDEGWNTTFVEFLKISGLKESDTVLVFSVGGGNVNTSNNIVYAMKYAQERKAKIVSIVSRDGGYARTCSDVCIMIPVVNERMITPHAEGWQGIVWHLIVNAVRN